MPSTQAKLGSLLLSVVLKMLLLVLIKNCNLLVYLIWILSNKLDLNQESHFTILVCSDSFWTPLPALLSTNKETNWTKTSFYTLNFATSQEDLSKYTDDMADPNDNASRNGNPVAGGSGVGQNNVLYLVIIFWGY